MRVLWHVLSSIFDFTPTAIEPGLVDIEVFQVYSVFSGLTRIFLSTIVSCEMDYITNILMQNNLRIYHITTSALNPLPIDPDFYAIRIPFCSEWQTFLNKVFWTVPNPSPPQKFYLCSD